MAGETCLGRMAFLSSLVLGATAVVLPRCICPVTAAAQADGGCDIVYRFLAGVMALPAGSRQDIFHQIKDSVRGVLLAHGRET